VTEWPTESAIRNCIAWNSIECDRAERAAKNEYVVVPASAKKRIWSGGKAMDVPLTRDEYRAQRRKDAKRYRANADSLYGRITKEAA
jgi:hypothetical protein